jgi:hypothetical protein
LWQGDPHLVGFRGQRFEVKGRPNATFAWYSDEDIAVNGFLGTNPGAVQIAAECPHCVSHPRFSVF